MFCPPAVSSRFASNALQKIAALLGYFGVSAALVNTVEIDLPHGSVPTEHQVKRHESRDVTHMLPRDGLCERS